MRRYLPSGVVMDISLNETGGHDVQVICPPMHYESLEEGLKDKYNKIYGALTYLKKAGIFSGTSHTPRIINPPVSGIEGGDKSEQKKQTTGKKGQTDKKDKGEVHKGKNSKGKSTVPVTSGVPPEDEKVIKTPVGGYIMIPDKAAVELFGTDTIQTTADVNIKGDPAGARAFTVNGKRYIAEFDKQGKFLGYFLSTDMKTKFTPDPIIYQNKVDDNFVNKLLEITYNLHQDPNKLMAVMHHESAGTFKPGIWNHKTAVGLIQFTPSALSQINKDNGTNYTMEQVSKMTVEEQLELVQKYYQQPLLKNKTLKTIEDYGIATFAPAAVGKASDYVIIDKDRKNEQEKYRLNSSIDADKNGKITNAEVGKKYVQDYVQ